MEQKASGGMPLSPTSIMHYGKLVLRSGLFLAAAANYVISRINDAGEAFGDVTHMPATLWVVWLLFVIEMLLRFFPSRLESMGCQKQFASRFRPTDKPAPAPRNGKGVLAVAAVWIALNGGIAALYFTGVIDGGILVLISLAYSVCDMICILFFCPFQTWFMKNKCCVSCRIYNWDYAMMFTPLLLVPHFFTWSLFGLALLLLIKWEVAAHRHPERFSEAHNASLSCAGCSEKLCHHKKQLWRFLLRNKESLLLKGNALLQRERNTMHHS